MPLYIIRLSAFRFDSEASRRTLTVFQVVAAIGGDGNHRHCFEIPQDTGDDVVSARAYESIAFRQPTPGLLLAMDPRLPSEHQAFELRLDGTERSDRVDWTIDGDPYRTLGVSLLWRFARGTHQVRAEVWRGSQRTAALDSFSFTGK